MSWIKKHKKQMIGIVLLAVVLIAAGVFFAKKEQSKPGAEQETTDVEKRTLTKSVSATGNFIASDGEKLTSETTGAKILAVNVEVGDYVAAGDTICILDSEDLKEQVSQLSENRQTAIDQAQRNRDGAARDLEQAKKDRDESIKQVDDNIVALKFDWEDAEKTYQESKTAYENQLKDMETITDTKSEAYYRESTQANTLKRQMEADEKVRDSYKKQYEEAQKNRDSDIESINNIYQSQEDAYNNVIDSTADVGNSQQDAIDELTKQIEGTVIKATKGGLVTAVNVAEGERYNGNVIAVIENVDSFDVTTEIGEYDINHIEVGQDVIIKTNATGEEELSGTVKKISPIATGSTSDDMIGGFDVGGMLQQNGISGFSAGSDDVTFTVTIAVNTPCDKLRIGMTAKLNIILQKSEDVLSLPYNVIQTDDDDKNYVDVVDGKNEDGTYKTKKVYVTKGTESDYYVEILNSDLKEGAKILLPKEKKGMDLKIMIDSSSSMGGI